TARVRTPLGGAEPAASAADAAATEQHRQALVDWAKGALARATSATAVAEAEEDSQAALELRFEPPAGPPLELTQLDRSWQAPPISARQHAAAEYAGRLALHTQTRSASEGLGRTDPCHSSAPRSHLGFQVHKRYLITENEVGMVVID